MRGTKLKSNKGITLIALVITIIVLLILAGVAISMLSGDNGILKQAANAKTEQEAAQKKEETALTDMEVITDFKTSGKSIKYKFKNGYLTGVSLGKNNKAETVETVEKGLPSTYEIYDIQGNKIANKTETIVTTGMMVKKGNNTVGRVVIFGDVNCDGKISGTSEASEINSVCNSREYAKEQGYQEYQIVAMDVNNDKMLNPDDANIVRSYLSTAISELPYNQYAYSYDELEITYKDDLLNDAISEEFKTKYNWHLDLSMYFCDVINVPSGTTVGEVLTDLESEYETTFNLYNEETGEREEITDATSEKIITNKSNIYIVLNEYYDIRIPVIVE